VAGQVLDRDDQAMAACLMEHYRKGDSILMLYRKSSDKSLIEKHIQSVVNVDSSLPYEARRLKQLTYHSAKGLQADAIPARRLSAPDQFTVQESGLSHGGPGQGRRQRAL
jgi:hypothetical protein